MKSQYDGRSSTGEIITGPVELAWTGGKFSHCIVLLVSSREYTLNEERASGGRLLCRSQYFNKDSAKRRSVEGTIHLFFRITWGVINNHLRCAWKVFN